MNVSWPTNGSVMILNASAESGRVVRPAQFHLLGVRVHGLPPAELPAGDGRKSTTASSSGCTPLFLNAEPHSTGNILSAMVAVRSPRFNPPGDVFAFQVLVEQFVVVLGDVSTSCSWKASAFLRRFVGNFLDSRTWRPWSSFHSTAFIFEQVDDALEIIFLADRNLQGHRTGIQTLADGIHHVLEIGARLSILLMKQMRGTPYLSAWRHTVSDCGCTPAPRRTRPPRRRARAASAPLRP